MATPPKPIILTILDGWGYSEDADGNAIMAANTPNWDQLWAKYPHRLISASGTDVGLPAEQMGNSEVGHLNIGAGRVVYQDYTRIQKTIDDGEFFTNTALCQAVDAVVTQDRCLHILGLVSPGGVHSHQDHIIAMLKLAAERGAKTVCVHAFLDGRDTPPQSAEAYLAALEQACQQYTGRIASITGRYYAMDRDKRWDRIQLAYDMLTQAKADHTAANAAAGLHAAYQRGENDEFVKPTLIGDTYPIQDGDAIIFMNFRADRARQLSYALNDANFDGFSRTAQPKLSHFVTLTEYAADLPAELAFPPLALTNVFADVIAQHGLSQLRIAETEKYAHVTFFFSGGREDCFPGEERQLIPSPKVATYDLQPEMSAPTVTDALVSAITEQRYDVIICNFANADMVGHTGNLDATIKAIECLDSCIGRIVAATEQVDGELLITADHGNAERMHNHDTGQAHTAHTNFPIPLLYIGKRGKFTDTHGSLCDIAPSLLNLLDIPKPTDMTGHSLLELTD